MIVGAAVMVLSQTSKAQLNPLTAQYYSNTYLGNPAFAGYREGLSANLAYRQQWQGIQGAPVTQSLTVDYRKNRAGVGLNVNFDRAGLQRQSRVMGTYAYHVPLGDGNKVMHFGLSVGFMEQRLSTNDIVGNTNDPLAISYNQRETYIDGDLGVGFTSNKLRIEAALPNLKKLFRRDEIKLADVANVYAAASYRLNLSTGDEAIDIEPKVAYRGFKDLNGLWDFGTQLTMNNRQILLTAIYHSTKSASFGLGVDYKRKFLINGFYTTQTSALNSYSNGTFELNLGVKF